MRARCSHWLGPWITALSAVPDPKAIQLWVNGDRKQDSDQRIHDFEELLVYLSLHVTLQPEDVTLTGTPAEVAFPTRDFLHPGDAVRTEVDCCSVPEDRVMEGT